MQKHCSIVGIPVESGAGRGGCIMGPDALRTAGLPSVIESLGYTVKDHGNLNRPKHIPTIDGPDHLVKIDDTVAWTKVIHESAYALASSVTFPIFIGGDHSMAAGTLTGASRAAAEADQPLFVLWLDAHPDMNTLTSTVSGHLHGTPMGYALGRESFDGIFPPVSHPLDPTNVQMMGLRSIDPPEHDLIHALGMDVWDMRRIDEEGVSEPTNVFLDRVAKAGGRLHVSLDVDFLDPVIAPAVGTTVPGGATFREAHLIMELLADSGLVTSLELTELNPFLDTRGKTAELMCDLTASLLGKRVLDRPTRRPAL